jgi:hypothetical protein
LILEKNLENKENIENGETLHHRREKDFNLLLEALLLENKMNSHLLEDKMNSHQKLQGKNI